MKNHEGSILFTVHFLSIDRCPHTYLPGFNHYFQSLVIKCNFKKNFIRYEPVFMFVLLKI